MKNEKVIIGLIVFNTIISVLALGLGIFLLQRPVHIESPLIDQATIEKERVANIDACIADAGANYLSNWNENCASQGLADRCALDQVIFERLDEVQKTEADFCFKKYPAN